MSVRADLSCVRAALAAGVFGSADIAWTVTAVCNHLEHLLGGKTMTADEARKTSALARTNTSEQVRETAAILRQQWDEVIEAAAKAGKKSVRESALPKLRTPVSRESRAAALDLLAADGFTVKTPLDDGLNELCAEVSW